MPYKFETEKLKLPRDFDRRVKLDEFDKADIIKRHKAGQTVRSIARCYFGRCSRRMIQFIIFPERLEHHKALVKQRKPWLKNNKTIREKRRVAIQKTRVLKKQLLEDKILKYEKPKRITKSRGRIILKTKKPKLNN